MPQRSALVLNSAAKALRQRAFHRFVTGEPLRVLVYEHVSGGGFAGKPIPPSVLCEGYAMLRGIIADFKATGHSVATLLDARIAAFNPLIEADNVIPVSSCRESGLLIRAAAQEADAALVIAPESNGVLQEIVSTVESTGAASLNSKAEAIERIADKAAFSDCMKARGVRVPETLVLNVREFADELQAALKNRLCFPLIFKPTDSTSCGGLSVVRTWDEVDTAVKKILAASLSERFVVQEFVEGVAASVSLIAANGEALPIMLNKQDVVLETPTVPSRYEGGLMPLDSPLRAEAFAAAKKTLQVFQGLSGYVGVDLVLTAEGPIVIEVNPRLTTSFVGLRNVVNFNVAQALIDAAGKMALPKNLQSSGYSVFSKMPVPNPSAETYQRALGMQEVVCPPFPMAAESMAYAFLCSQGNAVEKAQLKLREAKERLRRISGGGM